jgi:hypothetical protein
VRWIDFGKRDWVNNQIWELAWEKPMPEELKGKLQYYSNLICQNYDKLEKFSKEMNDFEKLLSEALVQYTQ